MADVSDPRYSDTTPFALFLAGGDAPEPPVGNRYVPRSPHAAGGLGEVLVAEDTELRREVALKRLLPRHADNPGLRRRFLTEAQITAHLEHPGVAPVHGLYRDADGRPCYAMRFVRGETLLAAIERSHANTGELRGLSPRSSAERRLEFRDLLQRFIAVCNAVAYAHSRGILHRDVKPQNVMLGKFGETVLLDWGLAKPFTRGEAERASGEESLAPQLGTAPAGETMMGLAVGTPAYMSPEQAAGRWNVVGPASDVYSLGATFYHLLTGRAPYQRADAFETLQMVQRGGPVPPRQVDRAVPAPLEAVCLKAMAREPGDRYASAVEFAADVQRWLADEPVTARREPLPARLGRWARRRRSLVTSLAALLVTAVLALTVSNVLIGREQAKTAAALDDVQTQRGIALANLGIAEEQKRRAEDNFRTAEKQRKRAEENERHATGAMSMMMLQIAMSVTGDDAAPRTPEFQAQMKNLKQFVQVGRFFFGDAGPLAHLTKGQRSLARLSFVIGGQRIARSLKAGGYLAEAAAVLRDSLALAGEIDGQEVPLVSREQVRQLEASMHADLGDVLTTAPGAPPAEAGNHYGRAVKLLRAIRAKQPGDAAIADLLRYVLGQLGNFHIRRGGWPEALASQRESVALCEGLVKQSALNADYYNALFFARAQVAATHSAENEPARSAAEYEVILKLRDSLIKEPPQAVNLMIAQAQTCDDLAEMLRKHDRADDAVKWYDKAVELLEAPAKRYPKEVGPSLGNARGYRAYGLEVRKRYAEAAVEWEKAAGCVEGASRLRFLNSACYNWAALGDHAKAVAEAEKLLTDPKGDALLLHQAAMTFGMASSAARKDMKLKEAERHVERALGLLTRARAAGVYNDAERVAELGTHPGLIPLRGRPAFDKLRKELERK
jgi:serine/threonine protein kinase/tetratricopeptide (TPR) repeat protein